MLDRVKNPVFARELSRWYKRKPFVVITTIIYLLYLTYFIFAVTYKADYDIVVNRQLGMIVSNVAYPVFTMIYLVVPALAATSVVSERRSRTLMPIQLSLLRPFDIVWAKIVAPVVPILFPAGISMLILGLILLKHGGGLWVSGAGAVFMFTWVMCSALIVSAVSVLISIFARSGAQAITLSYAVVVFLSWVLSFFVAYSSRMLAVLIPINNLDWLLQKTKLLRAFYVWDFVFLTLYNTTF